MSFDPAAVPLRRARVAPRLAAALCAAALAACAGPPTLRSEVVRFHAWQAAEPLSYAIRTPEPAVGTLEHRSYATLLRERLRGLGFVEAPAGSARYALEFTTTLVPETRRYSDWAWPSPWPGPYGLTPGPWPVRPGAPYWRYDPSWGLPPMPMARDETIARHELRVDLWDTTAEPGPGRKVWEARASAYAPTEAWPRLMPGLVVAAFADFPGDSGSPRRIEVPLPSATGR
ncbi:MAG: hypothetical protein RJA99_2475 [Pseudomonadota bacterium]|jgi:hypothetical protein